MTFIDTHTHLYDEAFDADREAALQRAREAGVETLLLPDIDSAIRPRQQAFAAAHPGCTRQMAGLHPTSVKADWEAELQQVQALLFGTGPSPEDAGPYIAVGEVGMDLYWDRTFEAEQREALRRQLRWAQELGLPVCLHIRKAHNEVFALLREMNRPAWRGVMHCFGGSVQEARRATEMGFHLGIGGVVTFKNAGMADVVRETPLERLLLETDAPYLSPVPHRGKRNESAYLPLVAAKVAELKGISVEEVAEATTASARELFAL
ncbi:MAG: TatD family hydrolase [Bacteroidales bacterium]|nr:TatD family hydrolase [Bacteroidales bacterium]